MQPESVHWDVFVCFNVNEAGFVASIELAVPMLCNCFSNCPKHVLLLREICDLWSLDGVSSTCGEGQGVAYQRVCVAHIFSRGNLWDE